MPVLKIDMITSSEQTAALQVRSISKSYGSVEALRYVDLDVKSGEFVTMLGASGSGKTTLLKIIAGFERPDSGQVVLSGQDVTYTSAAARNIGMVFQNYALFPHMTVEQNVAFPLEMRRQSKVEIRRRCGEALELVALGALSERYPHELSGGQQQRVALARATVFEPKLLLLDEPFSALDRRLRETMQREIKALQRRLGLTTIFITHDQEEALVMSDRVAVMSAGAVRQYAAPSEIYLNPADLEVARFVGDSNVLTGRLEREGRGAVFKEHQGLVLALHDVPEPAAEGGDVSLLLRPEALLLAPNAAAGSTENSFQAEITSIVFVGASVLYELRTASGTVLTARQSTPENSRTHEPGQRVTVHVPPRAGRVLSDG